MPQIAGIMPFSTIPVELKGKLIYDVTFYCNHVRKGPPDSRSELK